ncbi:DedA family protein [Jiella sp. MQZ9-1]|uniref:DedA family protein n=1 Tax=Jiella flava TaxID=2816857 RepID=A0A939G0C2_9HYPH|nr:DedA family protein [Jiella flava]MBO0662714.1 DedA family protein [Jiella flava]MCD2471136.1 DedA family protein [Jiella flava]
MDAFVRMVMETFGVFGIGLLMFLENIFPPIPSELIMPLAGYQSTRGDMSIVAVIASGTIGSLLGVIPWYYAGRYLGERRMKRLAARYGRWLTLAPSDVTKADQWFRDKGAFAVLIGRLVPTVRTLISVPAGIAHMPMGRFLVYSAIGGAIWTAFLAMLGFLLGQQYEVVEGYVGPVSNAVIVAIVVFYIYRIVTFDTGKLQNERQAANDGEH